MKQNNLLDTLSSLSSIINESLDSLKEEQEIFWNSLSEEDKLKVFCAVVRRIHKGEILEKNSYRGVLYDVFGFGPESYIQAQEAGYLEIHNRMYDEKN